MEQTYTYRQKFWMFIKIALPLFITQMGLFAMNFFDVVMSGNASPIDLAGVAIGSNLWVPIFVGLSGILMAITPIVAQLLGAQKTDQVPKHVFQGIYVSVLLALLVILFGSFLLDPILNRMNLEEDVRQIARGYLIALAYGIVPLFVYNVLRAFIDALGHTRMTMMITILAIPINFVFNYLLIFGKFGFPALGGIGAGYATTITYWCITILAFIILMKRNPLASTKLFDKLHPVSFGIWKEIFLIGLPIGLSIFFEVSIFAAVTLLMSEYDTITIASHQAAINFASFLYMIPLSISMALTVLVGFEVGAKRYQDAAKYAKLGISSAIILSAGCAIFLYFFRIRIAGIYTNDEEVLLLTSHFLIYALFFQLSDAIAAPIQGVLRGYKDVNVSFMMALVSYWVIGLPLGYYLANYTSLVAFGYWVGLITGLAAGAIGLSLRLFYIQRKNKRQNRTLLGDE